ncbi:hypothetical protein H5410_021830 [Solanum commersonii]|uniref:Uncharacterized protein n=1 Tax=Solanum commersonii TaxID=4109 RepID=A0A9J5ZDN1_SOLCO|nr:hypothetical protein H5410_021830 [Solanum commersonii]
MEMKLSNDDDNRRHHLRNINAVIQDARLCGKNGVMDLLITRHNSYLRRETELENEPETYCNIFYRRYL